VKVGHPMCLLLTVFDVMMLWSLHSLFVGLSLIPGMAGVSPSKNFQMSFTVLCLASEFIEN